MDLRRLLEKMNKFAGEPEQKPGDQVRGTEKAKVGGKEHPFKNRLVGASEGQESLLKELEVQLKEGELERELTNELNFFKTAAPAKPAPKKSYLQPEPEPEEEESFEDKFYVKGGQKYLLHREGDVFQLSLADKIVKSFTAPQKAVHQYLEQNGWKLQQSAVKHDPNWFREGDEVVAVDNPKDTVEVDIPLMIRLLEYAREDAKTDMDLHNVAEKLISLSGEGRTLGMGDYDSIVGADIAVDEEVAPAVATAGGPAGATQVNPQAAKVTDPAQAALQKQQQAKLQQNLANLKSAGVDIDPAKAAQTLQKTDTGAPMNAVDKDTISKLAPALGNVMSNPSTATQLNTLIKKAGGGA